MELSIIVPVYRVADTLRRCVGSIVAQAIADSEIILVDDGSPDECPMICDQIAQEYPNIVVIHKRNGGLSDARNAGIEAAKGEYVTFVDSDDFLQPDTYKQIMPIAARHDIVEFPVFWHYGAKEQRRLSFGNHSYEDMQTYWLEGRAYEHTYACNKIYRRELFSNVRFPVGEVFEDVATLPRLLAKTGKVATTETGLYYYCANPRGITAQATAHELTMLLKSHLNMLAHTCDPRYYMHVLNIQMDVCELSDTVPLLPFAHISPFAKGLSTKLRIKAIALNLLGIKGICKLNKLIHKTTGRRS